MRHLLFYIDGIFRELGVRRVPRELFPLRCRPYSTVKTPWKGLREATSSPMECSSAPTSSAACWIGMRMWSEAQKMLQSSPVAWDRRQ